MHSSITLSSLQQTALVVLRTLVGWHFLYEGYTKLLHPAWGRAGAPLAAWSSAAYLKAATGPLRRCSTGWATRRGSARSISRLRVALVAVGLSLMLGLFTQAGCSGALGAARDVLPVGDSDGRPEARAEGTYLLVNKNLIEACAVLVLFAFRTGRIAGLDRLWSRDTRPAET